MITPDEHRAELLNQQPQAGTLAVQFLRALPQLSSADDSRAGSIIRRVQVDILELIIRKKRRELVMRV